MTQFSEISKGRYINIALICTITINVESGIRRSGMGKMINGYDIHLNEDECSKLLSDISDMHIMKGAVE